MKLSAGETKNQLLKRSLKVVGDTRKGAQVTITREYDAMQWLALVSKVADALASKDRPLFCVQVRRNGVIVGMVDKQLTPLFLDAVRFAPTYVKKYYPYHYFDPRVEVFFRMLSDDPLVKECVNTDLINLTAENATKICAHLNQFVALYQEEISSPSFRVLVKRCANRSWKNCREMERYVEKLFERRSRLLVVRVDFYYPSVVKDGELNGITVTVEKLKKDRERYERRLKRGKLGVSLMGYCWKLEYGLTKGFHYHWLFFFDGAVVREDITLGRMIGEEWEKMQGGEGLYWNCNAFKDKYIDLGIGMVSHYDQERRFGLRKAIAYLTKPDYHLCLKEVDVGRTFGKGLVKARRNEGRGRPRVY